MDDVDLRLSQDMGAVVIGAGSGIGRGIALALAARGMNVMVADIDGASADAVRDEIVAGGATAASAQVDATDRTSLAALADASAAALGDIRVVVTTVGAIVDRRLAEATDADWAWLLDVNVLSVVRTVDVFLERLQAHGQRSHVVVTSSMAGLLALGPEFVRVHNGLYTTTKHALVGYADMLRQELAPEGIGVSVLCPGLVEGNLSATSARNRAERFGGRFEPPPRRPMRVQAMRAEDVGPLVADAIEANRFYIFTHHDSVAAVEHRHREVLADYEAISGDAGSP